MITSRCFPTISSIAHPPCLIRPYCRLIHSLAMGNSCSNHYSPIPSPLLICQRIFDPQLRGSNGGRFNRVFGSRPSRLNPRINCQGKECLLRRSV